MNMSKSVRRQLLCCDLIQGVIDACLASFKQAGLEAPDEMTVLLKCLKRNVGQASGFACQRFGEDGRWLLDAKASKQYGKSLNALQNILDQQYGSGANAIDYCKALQVWVEDIRDSLPTCPVDRRIVWRELADDLQALYTVYDPEWLADEKIDVGMAKGETLKHAAGVW